MLKFGLVMFPQMTALDLVAPELLMATMMATEVHLLASTMEPVKCDSNVSILPTGTYLTCPEDLDVLFVPGGPRGTAAALQDENLLNFIADRGRTARYVTSVCTGSVILGAAGLLRGYRASSYWGTRDMLSMFGASPVDDRVVIDRNRVTGGGLTAGLDFGLALSAILRGEETARLQELILEYDPDPPFKGGTVATARADTVTLARTVLARDIEAIRTAATNARSRRTSSFRAE
ncbi:DJ-1/PfpI family protein [Roseomonas hellenica]|nr:DJ-1/PfpI family protein [Plastoroseomonas hellenica]